MQKGGKHNQVKFNDCLKYFFSKQGNCTKVFKKRKQMMALLKNKKYRQMSPAKVQF